MTLPPAPNLILPALNLKRDARRFRRLLVTGPLTHRLDRLGARLNDQP